MRRLAVLALGVALVVPVVAIASSGSPPRASLAGFRCKRALRSIDRSISVGAVMRPITGTKHMSIRFELRRLLGRQGATEAVRGGDLGTWLSPTDPTLGQNPKDVWRFRKIVENLRARTAYRFRVTFRWTGSSNRVAMQKRLSPDCAQPDLRPDLLVEPPIAVTAISRTRAQYVAVIRNAGATRAVGPFEVALTFPPRLRIAAQTVTITSLRRHRSLTLSFFAPKCTAAAPPTVTVDPRRVVDDRNRRNNAVQVKCPPLH